MDGFHSDKHDVIAFVFDNTWVECKDDYHHPGGENHGLRIRVKLNPRGGKDGTHVWHRAIDNEHWFKPVVSDQKKSAFCKSPSLTSLIYCQSRAKI